MRKTFKNKKGGKLTWRNQATNKPLINVHPVAVNTGPEAIAYRKYRGPRRNSYNNENNDVNMSNSYKNGRNSNSYNKELNRSRKIKAHRNAILSQQNRRKSNSIWNNLRGNKQNNIIPIRSSKRRRPNNWNNNNSNNFYDPEENAEIERKMAALQESINNERKRR